MSKSDLNCIYSNLWTDSIDKFKNNECKLDPLINNPEDTRRGLTVLSFINGEVANNISAFLNELKIIEPHQYYYPANELHLTILSIISCTAGFKLSDISIEAYVAIFKETMRDVGGFSINYKGVTVSPSCVLIQGFPDSEQLAILRNALRVNFRKAKLESTIDARYQISTSHSTAVRCISPFKNSIAFTNVLSKYKEHSFGRLEVDSLDFVFNNWYQNRSITKKLSHVKLKLGDKNV